MESKTTDYCLLEPISSVEEFLKSTFKASGSKIKKHFKKAFLTRSFREKSVLALPLNFINDGEINPHYEGSPLEFLYEDDSFLVFTKNPNQFIHPLTYDESDNCLSYLRQVRPELLKVNSSNYDRGLLYRLDYETSGVVIYVKQDDLYKELRENFSVVAKEKIYWCWVEGECKLDGAFKNAFDSGEEKGKRVKVAAESAVGKLGELSVRPLSFDQEKSMTLVEVSLKTGLRHQIRAQLAYLGHPLIGDVFYGGRKASRLYLHALAYKLETSNKSFIWESKPKDFNGL